MILAITTRPADHAATRGNHMRKFTSFVTAMAMLALAVPMQASAETTTKTEAPKTAAVSPTKAKVATIKKAKRYTKRHRHHRMAIHKKHRRHMAASKTHRHVLHAKKHRKHAARNS